ncbi:hypothetical protein FQA39_LY07012 [Lamprigera yunnana]|nr:hypothetical protein FQA39_LY07012 [Lamprigera yunnana]
MHFSKTLEKIDFKDFQQVAFVKVKDLFYYLKHKKSFIKPLKRKDYNDALDEIEQVIKDCGGTDGNLEDAVKESEPISTVKQENNESMETKRKLSDLTEKTNNNSVSKKTALEVKRKSESAKVVSGIGRSNKKVVGELTPRKTRLRGLNNYNSLKIRFEKMWKQFLTQKELQVALEETVTELELERGNGMFYFSMIDAVYIFPDVDELTDEENIEVENTDPENELQPTDIVGTFELQVQVDTIDNEKEFDSSDDESLLSKKRRLGNVAVVDPLSKSLNNDDKEKTNSVKPLVESEKSDAPFDNNELKIQTKCLKAADIKMITEDYLVAIIAYAQFVTKEESTYKKKPIEIRTKFENEILLAKLPFGKYVGIKYNTSSPQPINNEFDQAVYDSNVAKSVLSLKKLVEDGTCDPDDDNKFIKDLDIEEIEIQSMIKSQIVEHRTYILNQLRIESRLIQLDSNIKNCLGLDSAYPLEATQYLQDMLMLDVTLLMLKKHPHIVEMIGKLKKYIGNTTAWNYTKEQCAQFEKEAKQVRDKADEIYHKFLLISNMSSTLCGKHLHAQAHEMAFNVYQWIKSQNEDQCTKEIKEKVSRAIGVSKLYKICDEDQFWKVFSNNIEAFRDQTKDLSEDSIFALASEPNSRQMFLDNIVKLEEMNIIVSNIGKSANNPVLF